MMTAAPTREQEQILWADGYRHVAGVDEVGRGCLAGPVTVAAVVLPFECELPTVRDSKLLTPLRRQTAAAEVKAVAVAIGIGWATSGEVDRLGLTGAQRQAAERALAGIGLDDIAVVLDGSHNYLGTRIPARTQIKADQSCLAVAAASVVAKVARDNYMELVHRYLPEYGFVKHKGYGSAEHLEALRRFGPTMFHRYSYQPVRELLGVG